jgi:hypothetical protein
VTSTPALLGPEYDAPAAFAGDLFRHEPKRSMALGQLKRAESAGDQDAVRTMYWELGLIDLNVLATGDLSPYGGGAFEDFASFYHLTEETVAYARARADETKDVILRINYLTFVLLRSEPKGRAWIDLQRELAQAYRQFVDAGRNGADSDPNGFVGVYIDRALVPLRQLLERAGVVRGVEAADWAQWFVALAEASRGFPERDERHREQQRHRWVADYLSALTSLPADAAAAAIRNRALGLLADANEYYSSNPLNDGFERLVAETEAALRKHWGESGTHEVMIRRSVAILRRRAEFHGGTGNGMLTAHFYREARRLVAAHRQYFTAQDVSGLQRAEQAALAHAADAGELVEIRVPMSIPVDQMDLTRATAAETVDALAAFANESIPRRDALAADIASANQDAPLRAMIGRTVISQDKVVGESTNEERNLQLDIEDYATLLARTNGAVVGITVIRAADAVGLTARDLLRPLDSLDLDAGTLAVIERGCERLVAEDFVSALHVLIPQFEGVLRQHLRSIGVDTTRFEPDVGDGSSRTDDATLGALLHRVLPDGRSVREYLESDRWDHFDSVLNSQTGLNLRNDVAHGLVRAGTCNVETAGLALMLLYQLAVVVG